MTRGAESILTTSFVPALASKFVWFGCPKLGIEIGRVAVSIVNGVVAVSKVYSGAGQPLDHPHRFHEADARATARNAPNCFL